MTNIQFAEFYFITGINEPEVNSLEFDITCGVRSSEVEDFIIGDKNIPNYRILLDNNRYRISFENYIGYAILDESYANTLGENYIGSNPRIYSESVFLDFIGKDTFATKDYPGPFMHYCFLNQNHILNVVSVLEPKIEKINVVA